MRKFEKIIGSNATLPQRSTTGSAGYDIKTYEEVTIPPMGIAYVSTGLKVKLPKGEYLQLSARSSLFKKYHCIVPALGIIDEDYYNNQDNEGHFKIVLWNISTTQSVVIPKGERVAQGIFLKYYTTDDDEPISTIRTGGFGSTDVKGENK